MGENSCNTATRRIISKELLCQVFGYMNLKHNKPKTRKLREKVFTDQVLKDLNITREEYRRAKSFTFLQSQRIIKYFDISEDELNDQP